MEQDPARIAEQAAEYFARRAPGARQPGWDGLEDWLRADVRHVAAYEETRQAWDRLDSLCDDPDLQGLMRADLRAALRPRRGERFVLMLTAALTLVAVLGGGYFYARGLTDSVPVVYATALGERRTEILADGTQIVLNTDTVLQVRYARNGRQVELRQGEAQFDVVRDVARPFSVHVDDVHIAALGTRFQVRRDAGLTRVMLLEGKVEVARGVECRVLAPIQQASWGVDGLMTVATIDPESETAWLQGRLRFRGTPLEQVIAEANRYSARKLRLGHPELTQVELSGTFNAGDTASIAAAAMLILPARVEEDDTEIVLLPR